MTHTLSELNQTNSAKCEKAKSIKIPLVLLVCDIRSHLMCTYNLWIYLSALVPSQVAFVPSENVCNWRPNGLDV